VPLRIAAILLAAAAALGCAGAGRATREQAALAAAHERTRCESDPAVLGSPARLRELGERQLAARDLPRSYCYFALLRTLHPERAETAEAFETAAVIAKTLFLRVRYAEPQSMWLTSEPEFLFAWFEDLCASGAFPQQAAEALLRGLPRPLADRLNAHLAASPARVGWRVEVRDDNGLIDQVRGVRVAPGAS
jgi:hypothetical protein